MRLAIPWRKVGLFQTLICFGDIPRETIVQIFVDEKLVNATFDEENCLVYEGNRLIPQNVKELWEWARGIWAGLIPLVPDSFLVWEDGIWNTCETKQEQILTPLFHIKGLITMNSMMQAMTSSSLYVVDYVAVVTYDQSDMYSLEVWAY